MSVVKLVIFIILEVIFAYFGLANAIVQLIGYFRFYRPLNKKMQQYEIYTEPAFANTVRGRLVGALIVLAISLAATVYCCVRLAAESNGVAVVAAIVALLFGLLLYAKKLRYELWNVQQFYKQYKDYLDKEKFVRFLRREYDISLEKLGDNRFVMQRGKGKG